MGVTKPFADGGGLCSPGRGMTAKKANLDTEVDATANFDAKVDATVTASVQNGSSSGPPGTPDTPNPNTLVPPPVLDPGRTSSSRGMVTKEILQ